MDYINKVKVDGTDYILSNLTDGTHTVSLPELSADDEFALQSNVDAALDSKANKNHVHEISDVTGLQTTLDGKQASIAGGASTITSSNLTVNRALVSNASGKVAISNVTSTELGCLDGVTSNIQTQLDGKSGSGHTHSAATTSASGFMTADMVTKLNGISSGANKTTVDSSLSTTSTNPVQNKVVKSSIDTLQAAIDGKVPTTRTVNSKALSANISLTASDVGAAESSHTHSAATTSVNGFMSSADKSKLDGIASGANKTTVDSALSSTSTNPVQNKIINSALNGKASTSTATTSANGLMSSSDKSKLDGIASGANKTTVDSALSSTSTNPVQNKVVQTALNGKAASSHTHVQSNITGLVDALEGKADKKKPLLENSVAMLDANGNIADSEFPAKNLLEKCPALVHKSVALLGTTGDLIDSGKRLIPEDIGAEVAGAGLYSSFTAIPANSDLNDYTVCGYYNVGSSSDGSTIANSPISGAFVLIVSNSNGYSDHDDISGKTWRYRLQRVISMYGKEYVRNVFTNGSGTVSFDDWHEVAWTTDTVSNANAIIDSNGSRSIKIGWNGDSLTSDNLKYLAGYNTSGDIKDVSWDAAKSQLGITAITKNLDMLDVGFHDQSSSTGSTSIGAYNIYELYASFGGGYSGMTVRYGTWTPQVDGASNYSQQVGSLLIIGKMCVLHFYIYGTFAGNASSRFKITGSPVKPVKVGGGGGTLSGYTSPADIVFTGYQMTSGGNIYAVGQQHIGYSLDHWESTAIYQKASGDFSASGTISFLIS